MVIAQGEVWWANVSQIIALDRRTLDERVGKLSRPRLALVLAGIDVMLGR